MRLSDLIDELTMAMAEIGDQVVLIEARDGDRCDITGVQVLGTAEQLTITIKGT